MRRFGSLHSSRPAKWQANAGRYRVPGRIARRPAKPARSPVIAGEATQFVSRRNPIAPNLLLPLGLLCDSRSAWLLAEVIGTASWGDRKRVGKRGQGCVVAWFGKSGDVMPRSMQKTGKCSLFHYENRGDVWPRSMRKLGRCSDVRCEKQGRIATSTTKNKGEWTCSIRNRSDSIMEYSASQPSCTAPNDGFTTFPLVSRQLLYLPAGHALFSAAGVGERTAGGKR